ncbi:cation diffusion facilitator family transporter [Marinobacter sp.]|uniref:cation diffusion facilitator family transporter n=1 Tax=Marinobacter sp. TaxID=50741 RepID=UPI000C42D1A9|nr:cation diffusion facilitator family transporter [Marinobacter sp.]MBE93917.1 hypothetical protein [Marinobacter sp.]|tara:strand:- start:34 stop:636 length:603 start_codon:yes stop_codon:yes gene_type:complete
MPGCSCGSDQAETLERKALIALLLLNAVMFVLELAIGLVAESTGLIADSLDMLADAGVYGVALLAVGKGLREQSSAAHISGVLQVVLGVGVIFEVIRRFVMGSDPESYLMMLIGFIALAVNICCLAIISRHRDGGVHMRASWIFSMNDVIANTGVIVSGGLVYFFGSRFPDLAIGAIISIVVIRGGIRILKEASMAKQCI